MSAPCGARTWLVGRLLVCDLPAGHDGQHSAEHLPGHRSAWREPTVWIDGEEYTLEGGREILANLQGQIEALDAATK